jgi:hypothetical protein
VLARTQAARPPGACTPPALRRGIGTDATRTDAPPGSKRLPPRRRCRRPAAASDPAFAAWLAALRGGRRPPRASSSDDHAAIATIVAQPVVLERDRTQAEFTLTLGQYGRPAPGRRRCCAWPRTRDTRTLLLVRVERRTSAEVDPGVGVGARVELR